jgi:hypothetical protein
MQPTYMDGLVTRQKLNLDSERHIKEEYLLSKVYLLLL